MHFIASRTKNYADKRELMNMVNELLGIQYNIAKANRTDRKVQNLAAYINADTQYSHIVKLTLHFYAHSGAGH